MLFLHVEKIKNNLRDIEPQNGKKFKRTQAELKKGSLIKKNKPDRATMRPDCVSASIEHVTYMERQMDEQTDETTE